MLRPVLDFATGGTPVFPCRRDKRPYTANGFKAATTDRETLIKWWLKWPAANIGMPTGDRSGVVVLDVDMDERKDGESALAELTAKHGALPSTREVRTPRGGRHLYFRHPGKRIPSRQNHPADALDVRGDGGYVLVPPSETDKGPYCYSDNGEATECPAWLVTLMAGETELQKPFSVAPLLCNSATPLLRYSVSQAIDVTCPSACGLRNKAIFNFARALKFDCGLNVKNPKELQCHVKAWWEKARPFIATKDFADTWADFLHGWEDAKWPFSSTPLSVVLAKATAEPPVMPDIGMDDEATTRIYGLVYWLAKLGGGRFYLSCHAIEKHMGIDHVTAWRRMLIFQKEGFLEVVKKGIPRVNATRYRWTSGGEESQTTTA